MKKNFRKWIIGFGTVTVMLALGGGVLRAQQREQPAASMTLEARLQRLEKENQQDYQAIRDLFQRLQNTQKELNDTRTDLTRRVQALSRENDSLRRRLQTVETNLEDSRRGYLGYPRVRSIRRSPNGNINLNYE